MRCGANRMGVVWRCGRPTPGSLASKLRNRGAFLGSVRRPDRGFVSIPKFLICPIMSCQQLSTFHPFEGLLRGDGLSAILLGLGSAQLRLRRVDRAAKSSCICICCVCCCHRHLNLCAAELSPLHSAPLVELMTKCPLEVPSSVAI